MTRNECLIEGVTLREKNFFPDKRGFFEPVFRRLEPRYGMFEENLSVSRRRVLRGLHYQLKAPQQKRVWVTKGVIFDVTADIRLGSPTYGKWLGVILTAENHRELTIPAGLAHGFCVLSRVAHVFYECTPAYNPADQHGLRWDEPTFDIFWPVRFPILSKSDINWPYLVTLSPDELPHYTKG